jgi:O-antigen/teichoic acid export membrane protein
MKTHLANAAYGILDYGAYPIGMLVVAPVAVRNLGIAQYGVWMFANAALATGSIVASGFGDANIRYVSLRRGSGDQSGLLRAVRSTMGIHIALGTAMALIAWMLTPFAAARIASADPQLQIECLWSLRITSLLILVRAIETVCVSTQRAFERYGAAIGYSVLARLLSLAAVVVLPGARQSVVGVIVAAAVFITASLILQLLQLNRLLQGHSIWPSFDGAATRALFGFGIFSWIQAASMVLFGQVDRLITGISLGAAAVASYALCAQLAQPIYGFAASGLHFLFPHVSARSVGESLAPLRRTVALTFAANLFMVGTGTIVLVLFGGRFLEMWAGPAVAHAAKPILPLLVGSTAVQGLSVTGAYTLLALGRVRIVTFLNVAGGAAMLLIASFLLPRFGAAGMAIARLCYGPFTLLVYVPLVTLLVCGSRTNLGATTPATIGEEMSL